MNIYTYPQQEDWKNLVSRPTLEKKDLRKTIAEIFSKIESEGDEALRFYTKKFDGATITNFKVSESEINKATILLSEELKLSIQTAQQNIQRFHSSQRENFSVIETMEGVSCWRESRGIEKIGIYIPGGTAPLFSTVLMLAIPAKLAGCQEVILCTPPNENGEINPAILYAANLCGVTEIYKLGGAQAIAALTMGTASIPKVYKIFGPGNQFVTAAKEYATEKGVAIDLPAGPSEVLVIADETANPSFCAADLLSQAEHGSDSQVIFITTDMKIFDETLSEVRNQLSLLPRKQFAQDAINNSRFIIVENLNEAMKISNMYAPEHLILAVENAEELIPQISNAGSVFLGNYSCESAGDYASGTNHTLPTNGYAKNYSGVSLDSFIKKITFQKITQKGILNLGKTIETMAQAEGLEAHKNAVSIRLKYIENGK